MDATELIEFYKRRNERLAKIHEHIAAIMALVPEGLDAGIHIWPHGESQYWEGKDLPTNVQWTEEEA